MARPREFDEEVVLYAASRVFGRAAMKIGTALHLSRRSIPNTTGYGRPLAPPADGG